MDSLIEYGAHCTTDGMLYRTMAIRGCVDKGVFERRIQRGDGVYPAVPNGPCAVERGKSHRLPDCDLNEHTDHLKKQSLTTSRFWPDAAT